MSTNQRSFYQGHDCAGFRATVIVEWSWPEGKEPPQDWLNEAEEIADEAMAAAGPKTYAISLALRGHSR